MRTAPHAGRPPPVAPHCRALEYPRPRAVDSIALAASYESFRSAGIADSGDIAGWSALDGQRATFAFAAENVRWYSDSTGVLSPMEASNARRKAPLTQSDVSTVSSASAATASSDEYVLADSATKKYSRSELEAMNLHTLFLARNEIFARHGRQFQSAELQQYFGSKGWCHGTIAASTFDANSDSYLNETEKANASLMLDVEKSRNSPYL